MKSDQDKSPKSRLTESLLVPLRVGVGEPLDERRGYSIMTNRIEVDDIEADRASMRLKDLQLTAELLSEAVQQENGARERVAGRHGIRKSVITDRVRRMERFFGVDLFTGPQRKTPTEAGRLMAKYGPRLIEEIEHFAGILRDASVSRELP
ncbi:hypothetical protein Rpal_3805 [Rhodopseudomonas palustris TIE-1]|uniref:LysR family transcriptional regulator n=1 Tax=Rhodopseudomonas palustris TaxID=1076 RepID=UPI00017797BE|nr:LysR family transcriptional regulator [Rhodopseudomonas palustris]ACF02304.1 hypothetical protein Rpal_3805 [Rhodopseudomonas palustris TIE-1]